MKLCLFLQRRFAPIGHELVRALHEKYGVEEFCGYVELRSSFAFLSHQHDIRYTKLILGEEILAGYREEKLDMAYLNSLEKKYGISSLWPLINLDRVIRYNLLRRAYPSDSSPYSREDMLKMLQRLARALERFLDEEKPDAIFFSVVSDLGSYLLYEMAKQRGIKILGLYNPRLGERYAITDDYFQYRSLEKAMRSLQKPEHIQLRGKAARYLQEFQKEPAYYLEASGGAAEFTRAPVGATAHLRFLSPRRFIRSVVWTLRSFYLYWGNSHRDDFTTIPPWYELYDKFVRKVRVVRGYRDFYSPVPAEGQSFAYFPLQLEPEALPMLLAPNYAFEQVWTIKQIARALPVSCMLYVKDHPVMVGRRPRSYYKELLKIPNVRLLDPAASSLKLCAAAKLVCAITGTAGMEAAFLKKPVIVFADVFYTLLPNVIRCTSVEELPELITSALHESGYEEAATVDFIAAIYKESVFVDLTKLWTVQGSHMSAEEKRELEPLADLIADRLQLSHARA